MNIFLTILEKVLYGTFNDQLKLQNNFAYKCEFNEIFENKIRNIGLHIIYFIICFTISIAITKLNFRLVIYH